MVYVLGMGCGCHASVSELNFNPFGASAGTFRGRVFFPVPPDDRKPRGYTPLSPFSFTNYVMLRMYAI